MKKCILIIEDEREISLILKMRLENAGYNVQQAYDGEEGLDMVRSAAPDLVLLDLILPKRGGLQVLEDIKGDKSSGLIPVILVTGLAQELAEVRRAALRADGYFLKPFDFVELLAAIGDFLKTPPLDQAPPPSA